MPIVHMSESKAAAEAVPGAKNVRYIHTPSVHTDYDAPADPVTGRHPEYEVERIIWLYNTHDGLCLYEREMNGYDDSDFFMIWWNEETGKPEHYGFASTRGWCYPCFASHADATPEVLAKFEAWEKQQRAEARERHEEQLRRTPAKGKVLKVVKGRKVPVGTVGVCMWVGDNGWGKSVGIKTNHGVVFTSIKNVEVATA